MNLTPNTLSQAMGFRQRLKERQIAAQTVLSVGLDPQVEKIPHVIRAVTKSDAIAVYLWMQKDVDATAEYASVFKPQLAHWLAIDGGLEVLHLLIVHIHLNHPDIPVFLDCKVGDISSTQRQYMRAHLGLGQADGMNYNGYMGKDTLKSLVSPEYPGRALVGLGRTSNAEAWEVQDAKMEDGRPYWEFMVGRLLAWSEEFGVLEDAGVVMGAAYPDPTDATKIYSEHLYRARGIIGDKMWELIPGIGTQGGAIKETVQAAYIGPGTIAVNSSSAITNVTMEANFAEASAAAAKNLRDEMNRYIDWTTA